MTDATTATYAKGDLVVATRDIGMYSWDSVKAGEQGVVTSVKSRNSIRVKFEHATYVRDIYVPGDQIEPLDPETLARMEAEKAEAEKAFTPQEGDILPEDPRLAWLWRAAAREATNSNHCGEYDKICDKLGIPGRERDFSISFTVGGLVMNTRVSATSKKLAGEKVLDTVPNSVLA